jgi:type IV pilus assembly protein PilO
MKKMDVSLNSLEPVIQKIGELTKIQRIIICCVTVALVVGGFVYFLYMPKYEDINKLNKDIAAQQEKLKTTKKNAAQYAEFQKKLENAQAKFNVVARALPLKDEIPSLLTSISQAGKDSGLTFLLFKPEKEIMKDFYAEIPVTMNLSGTYHDLGTFFDELAGMPRIVNINRFDMTMAKGSSLSIACIAETYKFVEPKPEADTGKGDKKKKKK